MRLVKRLTRNEGLRAVLCAAAALYIRLVYRTGRWRVVGGEHPAALWDAGRPFIGTFWHGRILMMPCSWRRGVPMNMLISRHPDGQLIARVIAHFGLGAVAGSSSKEGRAALRAILRALSRGECVGVTPDGPRGPRMRASSGVVEIARMSGAPVLAAAFSTSRRKVMGSWDRFVVALPFSRGVFVWSPPIEVPRNADAEAREAARRQIEDALNRVTAEADRLVGQPTIAPAPENGDEGEAARASLARPARPQ